MSVDPKSILDTVLTCWDRTAEYRKYIRDLGDNLTSLEGKMHDLEKVYEDVNRDVSAAEGRRWIRTVEVEGWLGKVEAYKKQVEEILVDGWKIAEKKCLCGLCCWNCRPRYQHSVLADKKKPDIEAELAQGSIFKDKGNLAYEPADLILESSLEALRSASDVLKGKFETLKEQVEREEKGYMVVRTSEVDLWWKSVEELLGKEVTDTLDKGRAELQKISKDGNSDQSQRDSPSYHGLAKSADKQRTILEGKLKERDGFSTLTCKHDDPPIHELPLKCYVGEESIFKEVWNWVEDEAVQRIGIVGMGGVGKTTLLHKVNNEFLQGSQAHRYDFAVLIVVSRPLNLDKIQEAILKESRIDEDKWEGRDREERASLILTYLREMNFLLFLDDLWDHIDLNGLGIPDHPRRCKIIFTTRDERVCNSMDPDKTKKVDCLPHDEALRLFQLMLGKKTWDAHTMIPEIAATMVKECKYLPLAIVTVARTMTGQTDIEDWISARKDLKNRESEFKSIETEVLEKLEFSYKRLPDKAHQMCFQYLSIFPEDHEICEGDAVNLWIGEGFLNEHGNVHDARSYGAKIFSRLRHACLVEFVRSSTLDGKIVRMHDLVREMALWVDSGHGLEKNRVLVQEEVESLTSVNLEKWKDAKRISLWQAESSFYGSLTAIPKPSFPHLSTLIIRDSSLRMIPDELFLSMPSLEVLDLSDNGDLVGLPDSIWRLVNLRYLNLNIITKRRMILVSAEIKNLNKLVVLILSRNFVLPEEAIPYLSSLRLFYWSNICKYWNFRDDIEIGPLVALQTMQNVQEVSLTLSSVEGVDKLLDCPKLPIYLRGLALFVCEGLYSLRISSSLLRRLKRLRSLTLYYCRIRQIDIITDDHESTNGGPGRSGFASMDIFHGLRDVLISRCASLVDMTSLIYHAPMLETLHIEGCDLLKEVIAGDVDDNHVANNRLFPCLTYLRLDGLTGLERICRRALPFPSLIEIDVQKCPELKELPLNCDSAKNTLQAIKGDGEWWEGLEWDDTSAKQVFSAKFVSSSETVYFR